MLRSHHWLIQWVGLAIVAEFWIWLLVGRFWRPDQFSTLRDTACVGFLYGIGQWLVLRGRINKAGGWPFFTVVGWVGVHLLYWFMLGYFPDQLGDKLNSFVFWLQVLPLGLGVGIMQFLLLAFTAKRPDWWVLVTTACWGIEWGGALIGTQLLQWALNPPGSHWLAALGVVIATGAASGLLSGWVLEPWLLPIPAVNPLLTPRTGCAMRAVRWMVGIGVGIVAYGSAAAILPQHSALILRGHTATVTSVAFLPTAPLVVSGSLDDTVRFWRRSDGALDHTMQTATGGVYAIAVAPNGTLLATGGGDGTVRLWRITDGTRLLTLTGHTSAVQALAFSLDGSQVFSIADTSVRRWRVTDGSLLEMVELGLAGLQSLAVAPDGQTLAVGAAQGAVGVVDLRGTSKLRVLRPPQKDSPDLAPKTAIAYSTDGRMLLADSYNYQFKYGNPYGMQHQSIGYIQGWNLADGAQVIRFDLPFLGTWPVFGSFKDLHAMVLDPQQALLALSIAEEIWFWYPQTGFHVDTFRGHRAAITSLAFSGDGQVLASGSQDGTVRLWEVPRLPPPPYPTPTPSR